MVDNYFQNVYLPVINNANKAAEQITLVRGAT
jgi:hypothetical protein